MADNERTSKPIASEAAKLMSMTDEELGAYAKAIRSVAASALTQTADKPRFDDADDCSTCNREDFFGNETD